MNNRGSVPSPGDQSALSLLVNAAHNHDHSRGQREGTEGQVTGRSLADALRMRGLGDPGVSLEEHLLLQQSQAYGNQGPLGLLSQLRDQGSFLSQLGQQNQLASFLGGLGSQQASDFRSAIAAQMRQNQMPPITQSDILALSRSGALSGLSGLLGSGLTGSSAGLASELENRQRIEEMERRQRLLAAASAASAPRLVESSESQVSPMPSMAKATESIERAVGSSRSAEPSSGSPSPSQPAPSKPRKIPKPPSDSEQPVVASESNHPKEEAEKTPGSVIVPCRARGMPMDHNFKTAYFVIPENVKHGEELICSYFACRNAGIKFRYCSHCKVPVAKRNFRKRHKHGGDVEDSGDEEVAVKKGIPSQITAGNDEATEADGISSQSADSNPHATLPPTGGMLTESDLQKGLVHSSMQTFESKVNGEAVAAAATSAVAADLAVKQVLREDREMRWASLLTKRPSTKNGDAMSAWLMEVLAVSDPDTSLNKSAETDTNKLAENDSEASEDDGNSYSYDEPANHAGAKKSNEVAKAVLGSFNAGIMKKKRPVDLLSSDGYTKSKSSDGFVGGSFAEWKERKKQKKQSKVGSGRGHATST